MCVLIPACVEHFSLVVVWLRFKIKLQYRPKSFDTCDSMGLLLLWEVANAA